MKFWFDTEFLEDGRTIELISIGVVAEDGREYYAEDPRADALCCGSRWLAENVRPHLNGAVRTRKQMADDLVGFFGHKPEIWAYFASYDWVVLCQLYGRMIDLPNGWPMWCRDVKQLASECGNPALPAQMTSEHNALADAIWTRDAWRFLKRTGA